MLQECWGSNILEFLYDENGSPIALNYNGTVYYYVTNLQGDVVRLITADGTTAAEYSYNAWGEITASTGSMAEINPIRYRGYYYDSERGCITCRAGTMTRQ